MTVRVLDVNEHSPEFTQKLYNVSVSEDSQIGLSVQLNYLQKAVKYSFGRAIDICLLAISNAATATLLFVMCI